MKLPDYCQNLFKYNRSKTVEVKIGSVAMGGENPIRLQSMTTTNTLDTEATVEQSIKIINNGGELVRITAQGSREAQNLENIKQLLTKKGYHTPLVADIHFNPNAAEIAANYVEKVRINPGNFADGAKLFKDIDTSDKAWNEGIAVIREKLIPFLDICKKHHTAIRIGTNHGSLSDRIMSRYGDTPQGMVEACMEYLRICREVDFDQIVLSIKASNTRIMVHTVRLLVATMQSDGMSFPLHLGVTEAGNGEDGRIKSAVGIGALLVDGIGDTIRVSLTEDPEMEIPVAKKLINYVNLLTNTPEVNHLQGPKYNAYSYQRQHTQAVLNIGGRKVPIVIQSISSETDLGKSGHPIPDYVFLSSDRELHLVEKYDLKAIVPYSIWLNTDSQHNIYPLINFEQYTSDLVGPNFVLIDVDKINSSALSSQKFNLQSILVLTTSHRNRVASIRAFIGVLHGLNIQSPIIINHTYGDKLLEDFQLKTSIDTGLLLIDGLIDGLFVTNPYLSASEVTSTQLGILQAARERFTKTDFISCPGCGRTLFDIQKVNAIIKEKTSHLKGLKIGIMGCIVNGVGEMADADYGYIGSGQGKVTLFQKKEAIKKNIPAQEAVGELILLIKENGDWVDPQ